ncbi:hypothetical protein ACFFLS_16985 [Flavobacterium procerum]|uniref:Uncharacterized protein n=1 Tax=Flavobacterium procerum TaxID=1455569 RepID=A0ABV6BTI3_9FLAO
MKETDKNLESLIQKIMADQKPESPSLDFTAKLMSEILVLEEKKASVYKPLISKSAWFVLFAALLGLVTYVSLFSGTDTDMGLGKQYVDKIYDSFSTIHFSKNVFYSILVVPIMILIQVGLLKNYFDKKYQI